MWVLPQKFVSRCIYMYIHTGKQGDVDVRGWQFNRTIVGHLDKIYACVPSQLGISDIDLTRQACGESLGTMQYSGVGAQLDFTRGVALSEHEKSIIVLSSQTPDGASRIVHTVGFQSRDNNGKV